MYLATHLGINYIADSECSLLSASRDFLPKEGLIGDGFILGTRVLLRNHDYYNDGDDRTAYRIQFISIPPPPDHLHGYSLRVPNYYRTTISLQPYKNILYTYIHIIFTAHRAIAA